LRLEAASRLNEKKRNEFSQWQSLGFQPFQLQSTFKLQTGKALVSLDTKRKGEKLKTKATATYMQILYQVLTNTKSKEKL